MSNNCLITKLNSAVSGDAPIFGNFEVVFAGTGKSVYQNLSVLEDEESIISWDNGIIFNNYDSTLEYSNPFTLNSKMTGFRVTCTTDAKVTITNKYKLCAVKLTDNLYHYSLVGVKEFIGGIDSYIYSIPDNTTYLELTLYSSELNLSDIVPKIGTYKSVTNFNFQQNPLMVGNINIFCNINNLQNIDIGYSSHIYGTIADLKSITTLKNIAIYNTQVGGTIEEFVAGQREAGRTTGSVSGNSLGWGLVTFDGERTHAKGIVTWTDTTITMDNVTINA